jgi:hypothetical protein
VVQAYRWNSELASCHFFKPQLVEQWEKDKWSYRLCQESVNKPNRRHFGFWESCGLCRVADAFSAQRLLSPTVQLHCIFKFV